MHYIWLKIMKKAPLIAERKRIIKTLIMKLKEILGSRVCHCTYFLTTKTTLYLICNLTLYNRKSTAVASVSAENKDNLCIVLTH